MLFNTFDKIQILMKINECTRPVSCLFEQIWISFFEVACK